MTVVTSAARTSSSPTSTPASTSPTRTSGGRGDEADYQFEFDHDTQTPVPDSYDPKKFNAADSYDLVGDKYNADDPGTATPHADPNPLDCSPAFGGEGHGSHTAGIIAGYGVTADGQTYTGPYDSTAVSTGTTQNFEIGPGMAPEAQIMSLRVFGCQGSTNVVADAIDRAMDPNGDGDTSDHADVINMSLGSDYGSPDDGDAVAANAAADLGISVSISMGNSFDVYDVGGSPGTAAKAITVAASVDAQSIVDSTRVSFDGTPQDSYASERSVAYNWGNDPDLSGDVAIPQNDTTGCQPFTEDFTNEIVLLTWTDDSLECGSAQRAANVEAAGGTGFIFASNLETFSAGITGSADVPGVLMAKSGGDAIRAAITAGQTVAVTATSSSDFRQLIPGDNDKVADFSSRGIRAAGDLKPNVAAVGGTVFSALPGSGSGGQNMSGTSMAAPMVAGLAAIVKSKHPAWTSEQVKADIVNTADKDLYVDGSADPSQGRYAPMRVGSGRIDAAAAITNDTLATVVEDPGTVALSWGTVAVSAASAPSALTKTVNLQNTGPAPHTYAVTFDKVTDVPGVTYAASSTSVTVPAGGSRNITITLQVDPSQWSKTFDPTKGDTDPGKGRPQQTIAESSGDVTFTPRDGSDKLRVPYYSAPKTTSAMSAPASLVVGNGTTPLRLTGTGLNSNNNGGVFSLGQGFELQATSPVAPFCGTGQPVNCKVGTADGGADIQYVGTSSDIANGFLYFAVSTHGVHSTPAGKYETDIFLDTSGDGKPDLVAFNAPLGSSDVMVEELFDLTTNQVVDVEFLNNSVFEHSGSLGTLDTAMYDSDVTIYPVWLGTARGGGLRGYGVSPTHPVVGYGLRSFGSVGSLVDEAGLVEPTDPTQLPRTTMRTNAVAPGVVVNEPSIGATLVDDRPSASLTLTRDLASYNATQGKGLLFFHLHNAVGKKAQVIALRSTSSPRLSVRPSTVGRGAAATATVTVPTVSGVPTGRVTLKVNGRAYRTASLSAGRAVFRVSSNIAGRLSLTATYAGDAKYLAGNSNAAALTVAKSLVRPTLTAPHTVHRGKRVTARIRVATIAGVAPTGRVTVRLNGKTLTSVALRKGQAVVTFKRRVKGTVALVAAYGGDRNYLATTSRKVNVRIT